MPRSRPTPQTLWDNPDKPTWSVAEVGEAVAVGLRRAFPEEVWVRGVIRNLNRGRGGTVWFDLIEPAPGGDLSKPPLATLAVVLFDDARRQVNSRLGTGGNAVRMVDGTEVRVQGRPSYWPRGGRLQLQMSDIDPDFTLGRLAADRERLLRRLDAEGLLGRQSELPPPLVPRGLGLVTSSGSAAEHDVLDELRRSGIGFWVIRADVRVQGYNAARSVAWGLGTVAARGVDAVLLVRGGGATTDLAAFDSELIARTIASLDVPVLTGIGHDIDHTIADEVAHGAYKTPTACAQAVVDDVRAFERRTVEVWHDIAVAVGRRLRGEAVRLSTCGRHVGVATRQGLAAADRDLAARPQRLRRVAAGALDRSARLLERSAGRASSSARGHLRGRELALAVVRQRLAHRPPRLIAAAAHDLDRLDAQVRALDPARTLARGWSITRDDDGQVLRSAASVADGDSLTTTLADGDIRSTVTEARGAGDD
ncbi:MAG TPA: exodeoxyribonuclease VII large subunit [Acidimicrobiales bacterium]